MKRIEVKMNSVDDAEITNKIMTVKQAKAMSVKLYDDRKYNSKYPKSGYQRLLVDRKDYRVYLGKTMFAFSGFYVYIWVSVDAFSLDMETVANEVQMFVKSCLG